MNLNGKWLLREKGSESYYEATVPGCNYSDLIDNGVIADPFIGVNEKSAEWVSERDWEYSKKFVLNEEDLKCDRAYLKFDYLDTIAEIVLNGKVIKNTDNCHIGYRIDVKNELVADENELKITFRSPVNYVLEKQKIEQCPINSNGLTGIAHIRKPQCHFGWDWGPNLPVSGITGNVELEFRTGAEIGDIKITQEHINKDSGTEVRVLVEVNSDYTEGREYALEAALISPDGSETVTKAAAEGKNNFEFTVTDPKLWEINGATDRKEQPLYTVEARLTDGEAVTDRKIQKIGLRTLKLDRSADSYGENFRFFVNGNPVFAKGANWIPADSLPSRVTNEVIDEYIKIALDSSFNMIRIWGGGYYGSDYFYEQCDRFGILVWQDFMFACQAYPFFDDNFTANVLDEVEYNVKRLRNHPSLCVWCGNNEIEAMSTAWALKVKYREWTEKFFYHILPEALKKYDDVTPFIPGSPTGRGYMDGHGSDDCGDTHLWAVWHGLQTLDYYRTRNTRFCSEFGFESLPDMKTVKKFAPDGEYSLDNDIFKAHQKCASGNDKMRYYIADNFRLPERFEDYVYLSQICQSVCVGDATEHWRRNAGRCNGSLYWQFNDCWPVCSWAGTDYYRRYKAVQYDARKFFKPFTVSLEDGKESLKVFILNDKITPSSGKLTLRLVRFDGKELLSEALDVSADKNESKCVREYKLDMFGRKNLKNAVFVAELTDGEEKTVRTVLFNKERKLKLGAPNIDIDVKIDSDTAYYTIKSDGYVRKLALYSEENAPFSDNYFDLLPNEAVTVGQKLSKIKTAEQIKSELSFNHVGLVKPAKSRISDLLIRLRVFLQPVNFGSYIYYKFLM